MNITPLKADLKLISREPIMLLILLVPVLMLLVIKPAVIFLVPFIKLKTGFNLTDYYAYVLSAVIIMTPMMTGTVAGFLMIDERDSRIYELMSITPAGYTGYMANRLALPLIITLLMTFVSAFILDIFRISFVLLAYLALLSGIQCIITGLLLFRLADDKVKGLTISKGMSGLMVAAFADLLHRPWISTVGALFPYYWISRLITGYKGPAEIIAAAAVHLLWLIIAGWPLIKVNSSSH